MGIYIYIYKSKKYQTVIKEKFGESLPPIDPRDFEVLKKIDDVVHNYKFEYLNNNILPRSLFGIESDFVEKNPDKVREFVNDDDVDFEHEIKLFTNDKAGKAGRAKWYVAYRNVIQSNPQYIDEWQVIVSSANAGGQKRDNQISIADNHSAFGRSRVGLKSFQTRKEAENYYKYANSYLIRFAFLMTDEALTSLGKKVPDLLDYSDHNAFIHFDQNIDEELAQLFGLSADEMNYIKERVDHFRDGKEAESSEIEDVE